NQGAQGDQHNATLRAILNLGKGPRLIETEADKQPSGIRAEGRKADDPFDSIEAHDVCPGALGESRIAFSRAQILADTLVIIRIASKAGAVTSGDGQRGAHLNAHMGDVVSQPIQAKRCNDGAGDLAVISIERQHELNDLAME